MRFYAERPLRVAWQLLADVLVIAWAYLVVRFAQAAQDLIDQLQGPAGALRSAGQTVRDTFAGAARTASGIPLVGDDLAKALNVGTGAGDSLAAAGRRQAQLIDTVGLWAAVAIVAFAAVPVVLLWLFVRVRYARTAGSAVAARALDLDLLALRALAHQPTRQLLRVAGDPAAAWRRDDPAVVRELAALELRALGLRVPRPRSVLGEHVADGQRGPAEQLSEDRVHGGELPGPARGEQA
jgi:hypothetical protein